MEAMRCDLFAVAVTDEDTRRTIRKAWEAHRLLLEPHGAVGWAGLERYLESQRGTEPLSVSVETAHPAKFPGEIENLIGIVPDLPDSLVGIESRAESFPRLSAEYADFKAFLSERYIR